MIQFRKATLSDLPEMMALFEMGIQSLKKQGSPQWQNGYGPTREKIKEDIKAHEGQIVEMTLENGRKRQKSKQGRLIEVYPSLFIVEYSNEGGQPGEISNTYVESYTYSDILTEKNLIRYFDE